MKSFNSESRGGRDDVLFAMEPRTFAGFLVAFAAVIVIAVLSYDSLRTTKATAESLARTVEILGRMQTLLSTLKDAETGQRGYLLTGRDEYLEPYLAAKQALPAEFVSLQALTGDDPAQHNRLQTMQSVADEKMQELGATVDLRKAGKADEALARVMTGQGKNAMDRIRLINAEMQNEERQLIAERTSQWRQAATFSFAVTSGGSLLLLVLIAIAGVMASRDFRQRQRESWLRAGQSDWASSWWATNRSIVWATTS